jgi:hypothetical protein
LKCGLCCSTAPLILLLALKPIIWLRFAKFELGLATALPRQFQSIRTHDRKDNPGLFEGRSDPHQGQSAERGGQWGRLFGLPITIAESHTPTATVLVDELAAGHVIAPLLRRPVISLRTGKLTAKFLKLEHIPARRMLKTLGQRDEFPRRANREIFC